MRLRMFNRELGRRVEALFEDCQVFDSAALAVPAFVSAALLQDWQQRVEVAGRTLVVRRAAADAPGVLLPLADVRPDGTAALFPDEARSCCAWPRRRPRPAGRGTPSARRWSSRAGSPPPGRCCCAPTSGCG
jgi:hypothetical protein